MSNYHYTNALVPKTNPLAAITFHFTAYIASTDAAFFSCCCHPIITTNEGIKSMVIDLNQDPQEGYGDALPNFNNPTPDQDEVHEDEHASCRWCSGRWQSGFPYF